MADAPRSDRIDQPRAGRFLTANSGAPGQNRAAVAVSTAAEQQIGSAENRAAECRRTVGIDLGSVGALALVDDAGNLLELADMPVPPDGPKARPSANPALLVVLLRDWRPARAFVEFVGPMPGDGPAGAFAFGKARGHVEATLAALGIPLKFLSAPSWKRTVGIPPGKGMKSVARAEACRRWPGHAATFARAKDDGRAEAALIAVAGQMREAAGR